MRKSDDDAHLLIGRLEGQIYRRANASEAYVSVPPALVITDSDGSIWSLGYRMREYTRTYEFDVVRNDVSTGEFAERIEYRGGVVRIFGKEGWRSWSRSRRGFI